MENVKAAPNLAKGSDMWVAALMVLCLGLGAFATYLGTGGEAARKTSGIGKNPHKLEGALINAPIETPVVPLPGASDVGQKSAVQGHLNMAQGANPDAAASLITPKVEGAESLNFELLSSFYYEDPNLAADPSNPKPTAAVEEMGAKNEIPAKIKAYDGKKIAIQGFMAPIKIENQKVRTFILVKNQMLCCFGQMPRMNEWIYVEMKKDKASDYFPDVPVTVVGKISVGEEKRDGVVLSIYRMEAERTEGPLDL